MAIVTKTATIVGINAVTSQGLSATVKHKVATIELDGTESAGSTIAFFEIPSDARVITLSKIFNDDLASSGAPTLDVGLKAVNGNVTSDDDAFFADHDLATAGSKSLVVDHAKAGKQAWEFVNGVTKNPRGGLIVYATIKDAAINVAGTLTLEMFYSMD